MVPAAGFTVNQVAAEDEQHNDKRVEDGIKDTLTSTLSATIPMRPEASLSVNRDSRVRDSKQS